MVSTTVDDALVTALTARRAGRQLVALVGLIVAALALWSAWGTGFNPITLAAGVPQLIEFAMRLIPPSISALPKLWVPLVETLQMALWGTTIPIFIALPLAFLAAENTTPHRAISAAVRVFAGTLRTVPELVWALLLVSAVGLGPFPGVLALALHTTGSLTKFYYEGIESVSPGVIEAMEAIGANRFKVIWYGILPSAAPVLISTTIFYWEYNNRSSAVLGLVGAGGIGLALSHAMQDFRYPEALTCLILIVLVLLVIDRISAEIRARVI